MIKLQIGLLFKVVQKVIPISMVINLILLMILIPMIYNSPDDYQQKETVKIMYIHVPSAWISLFTYTLIAFLSICSFIWKNAIWSLLAQTIAPIGAIFTALALITGSIWGYPIWGTWWVWDARLTSMLILFLLYISYIILVNSYAKVGNNDSKAAAILSIIGLINIPIIKFSVEIWNTLHQPASILRGGGVAIHSSMLTPLIVSSIFFLSYLIMLWAMKLKVRILELKAQKYDIRMRS